MPRPNFPQIAKAARVDFFIQQGSTFMRSLKATDIDLTPYGMRGRIRKTHSDKYKISSFDCTIVANNEISIVLTSQNSCKLKPGWLVYDFELFYQEDDKDVFVVRILEGRIKVTPEVTR